MEAGVVRLTKVTDSSHVWVANQQQQSMTASYATVGNDDDSVNGIRLLSVVFEREFFLGGCSTIWNQSHLVIKKFSSIPLPRAISSSRDRFGCENGSNHKRMDWNQNSVAG